MSNRAGPGLITYLAYALMFWRSFDSGCSWPRWLTKAGSPPWPRRAWSRLWPRPSQVSVLAPQKSLGRAKRLARLTN